MVEKMSQSKQSCAYIYMYMCYTHSLMCDSWPVYICVQYTGSHASLSYLTVYRSFLPKIRAVLKTTHLQLYEITHVRDYPLHGLIYKVSFYYYHYN